MLEQSKPDAADLRATYVAKFRSEADEAVVALQTWSEALARLASETPDAIVAQLETGDEMFAAAVRSQVFEYYSKGFAAGTPPAKLVDEAERELLEASRALGVRSDQACRDLLRELRVATLGRVLDLLRALRDTT